MERETRFKEQYSSREKPQSHERVQTGEKPEVKSGQAINVVRMELKELEKLPVVAVLVVPTAPEKPEERKKKLPEKIFEVIEWIIRCAKHAANPSSTAHTASRV